MGDNVGVRKLVIGISAVLAAVVVGAVGTDFGAAIYAEYRLARSVRSAADGQLRPRLHGERAKGTPREMEPLRTALAGQRTRTI